MWTASFSTIIVFSFYVVQLPIFQNATWARKVGLVQFHRVDYDQKVGLLLLGLAMCMYVKVAAYSIRFECALWYAGLRRTDDRLRILLGFKQRKSTVRGVRAIIS